MVGFEVEMEVKEVMFRMGEGGDKKKLVEVWMVKVKE